jgi:hypothetical protein
MFLVIPVNFSNENVYSHKRGNVSDFLNRFLYDCLCLTLGMMLKILFCNINVFLLLDELSQKHFLYLYSKKYTK